jgi:hypothetical protein
MARNQDWASLRREATELGHQIRDLGTSYGTEKQRKLLCSRLLKLLGRAYPLPHELTEALAIALHIDPNSMPGKLGYGLRERDKFIAAIMAEKRYLAKYGRPASAYRIAQEVSKLTRQKGLSEMHHETVKEYRKDPRYKELASTPLSPLFDSVTTAELN